MKRWMIVIGVAAVVVVAGGLALVVLGGSLGESAAGDVHPGPAASDATAIVMHDNSLSPAP